MKMIIDKILKEVDPDIRELMLMEHNGYAHWQLLVDPCNTILNWQFMRDRKKHGEKITKNL